MIIILDEFPWAVDSAPSLPSRHQTAWDNLFRGSRICLVTSGSHVHAVELLLRSDAPLVGCVTAKLYVPLFQFTENTLFAEWYISEKQLAVYAMLGGIPDYLRRWNDRAGLMDNVWTSFSPISRRSAMGLRDLGLRCAVGRRSGPQRAQ